MAILTPPSTTFIASTTAAWLAGLAEVGLLPRSARVLAVIVLGVAVARCILIDPCRRGRLASVLVYPVGYALLLAGVVAWYAATRGRLLMVELLLPTLFVALPYAAASVGNAPRKGDS